MARHEFTTCVDADDFVNFGFNAIGLRNIFAVIASGGVGSWLIAVFLGGPGGLIFAVFMLTSLVAYLHWWLHGRLICLGGERCMIGMVRSLSAADPAPWGKAGDNDFSINLLLAPGPTALRSDFSPDSNIEALRGPPPPVAEYQSALQGELLSEQPAVAQAGRGYVSDQGHEKYLTALHSEFEGNGIHNLLIWAQMVLALLIAALGLYFIPGLGWLVSLLIYLAIFLGASGALIQLGPGPGAAGAGDPSRTEPVLASLAQGDIVVTKGVWVYDSLHGGWNEQHPIRDCVVIGHTSIGGPWLDAHAGLELDTPAKVQAALDHWCSMLDNRDDALEGGNQDDPANDWILHPAVDGCAESVVIL